MLNRAQLRKTDAEATPARTMQFVIERPCRITGIDSDRDDLLEGLDPAPAWVYMTPIKMRCGGMGYQMTDESLAEWCNKIGLRTSDVAVNVCEHMGHLIE